LNAGRLLRKALQREHLLPPLFGGDLVGADIRHLRRQLDRATRLHRRPRARGRRERNQRRKDKLTETHRWSPLPQAQDASMPRMAQATAVMEESTTVAC